MCCCCVCVVVFQFASVRTKFAVLLRFNRRYLLHSFHYKNFTPHEQSIFFLCRFKSLRGAFGNVCHSFALYAGNSMKRYAKHLHLLQPLVDAIVPLNWLVVLFSGFFVAAFLTYKSGLSNCATSSKLKQFSLTPLMLLCLFHSFSILFFFFVLLFLYSQWWNFVTVFSLHATDIYIHSFRHRCYHFATVSVYVFMPLITQFFFASCTSYNCWIEFVLFSVVVIVFVFEFPPMLLNRKMPSRNHLVWNT